MSQHFDAVHLTVAAYLNTAGRAIPVEPDAATLLAGWAPDETVWLTDGLSLEGAATLWRGDRHDGWKPESG